MLRLEPEVKRAGERASEGGRTVFGVQNASALNNFLGGAREILGNGVEIKDFDLGLCDFPHERDGKIVYLCLRRGEDRIDWWHDLDAGFAGRRPL